LLKLANRYPDKSFVSKNHMMAYMGKVFRYELHQAVRVNNPSFRFAVNHQESQEINQREKYLAEVEGTIDTSYQWQLRRKIAGIFAPKLAYQLLTTAKFDYRPLATGQLVAEPTDSHQCLTEAQEILEQESMMTITVASSISLSPNQQQALNNAVKAVYGSTDIIYRTDNYLAGKHRTGNYGNVGRVGNITINGAQASSHDSRSAFVTPQAPVSAISTALDDLAKDSAWYQVRSQLREYYGEAIDRSWFSKLRADDDISSGTLTLYAPTQFIADWVSSHHGRHISNICQALFGFKFYTIKTILEKYQ
jgi:hypothetical protein